MPPIAAKEKSTLKKKKSQNLTEVSTPVPSIKSKGKQKDISMAISSTATKVAFKEDKKASKQSLEPKSKSEKTKQKSGGKKKDTQADKNNNHDSEDDNDKVPSKKVSKSGAHAASKPKEVDTSEPPPESDHEEEFFGFETDDDDSSDEEDVMDDEPSALDITKLPTISKDDAVVKKKLEKAKRKPTEDRGVIYLGRIPHGFYEDQMKSYFEQFGNVTRVRLSRNKRTGRSKHYAFIEFDSSSVAQIVAETMDNYLLMGHILTCKVVPKDEVHPDLWIGANRKWKKVPNDRLARVNHNKPRTEEEQDKAEARLLKRQEQRKRKLAEAGISYDFDAVAYKKKAKPAEA